MKLLYTIILSFESLIRKYATLIGQTTVKKIANQL